MTGAAATKTGHFLAKILGIDLHDFHAASTDEASRGESVLSADSGDTFVEEPPTTAEYFKSMAPSRENTLKYTKSLLPFMDWIGHYNLSWLVGDAVAG